MRQHSEHPFGCCLFRRERSRESCSIHSIGHLDQFASVVIIAAPERVWDAWVGQAVQDLTDKRLLRQLVPVTPIGCPTNVREKIACFCLSVAKGGWGSCRLCGQSEVAATAQAASKCCRLL